MHLLAKPDQNGAIAKIMYLIDSKDGGTCGSLGDHALWSFGGEGGRDGVSIQQWKNAFSY